MPSVARASLQPFPLHVELCKLYLVRTWCVLCVCLILRCFSYCIYSSARWLVFLATDP